MPPLRRILTLALILLGVAVGVTYYLFEVSRIRELKAAIAEREVAEQRMRDNVRNLGEKVSFYKTREGIEHLAREQYNLVGEGERVFLLRSPDQ